MLGREREVNEKLERNLSSIVEWLFLIRFSIIVIIILLRYLLYRASISSIQTQFKRSFHALSCINVVGFDGYEFSRKFGERNDETKMIRYSIEILRTFFGIL